MDAADRPGRTGIELLRDVIDGRAPMPPVGTLLGWTALTIEPGYVRVRYTARQDFYNPAGNVQGGILASMLDDAMGPAAVTLLGPDEFATTLELKVSFVRPARAGTLIAEGRVVHRGRSILFLEGALATEDGQLVAAATATARVVPQSLAGGGEKEE